MSEREVIVQVKVRTWEADAVETALEMVKDALASRSALWQYKTFVSESDVKVVLP